MPNSKAPEKTWSYSVVNNSWTGKFKKSVCTYYFYMDGDSPARITKESWNNYFSVYVFSLDRQESTYFKTKTLESAKFESLIIAKGWGWDITDQDLASWSKPEKMLMAF